MKKQTHNISLEMAKNFEKNAGTYVQKEIKCTYYPPEVLKTMSKKAGNGYKQYVHK